MIAASFELSFLKDSTVVQGGGGFIEHLRRGVALILEDFGGKSLNLLMASGSTSSSERGLSGPLGRGIWGMRTHVTPGLLVRSATSCRRSPPLRRVSAHSVNVPVLFHGKIARAARMDAALAHRMKLTPGGLVLAILFERLAEFEPDPNDGVTWEELRTRGP